MRILLIRLRLIGDVVFTTPAIAAIARALPDAHLTYLVEPPAEPVVRHNPHLHAVRLVRRPRGLERVREDVRLARQLRGARFDAVIDFHGGPRSAWLTLATGAPLRIGYDMPGRPLAYTARVPRARALRPRHSVVNQWDLLAPLVPALCEPPDPARDPVEMIEDRDAAMAVERRIGGPSRPRVIVVHVSAGNVFRRWPAAAFEQLLDQLVRTTREHRVVVTSGPSDHAAAVRIAGAARARLGDLGHRICGDEEFSLAELHALIRRADLFIGGDSGPLHVAATTATPIVGVYGPTLPERSAPWRDPALVTEQVEPGLLACRPCDQRACAPGDFRCLTGLAPATVVAAARRALARAGKLD